MTLRVSGLGLVLAAMSTLSAGTQPMDRFEAQNLALKEVEKLSRETDYQKLTKMVKEWKGQPRAVRTSLIFHLSERLKSTKELKLENYADMFVISRILNGRMDFHGHGEALKQDVFLENGRCAWALENLLGIQLPPFEEKMKADDLQKARQESCLRIIAAMEAP